MNLSSQRMRFGINCQVAITAAGLNESVTYGLNEVSPEVLLSNVAAVFRIILAEGNAITPSAVIALTTLNEVSSTAWVAGNAQSITRVVTGTAEGESGSEDWTITAAGLAAPVVVSVYRGSGDTNAEYANSVRSQLDTNEVGALFTVSGTGADVILTRKPSLVVTQNGATLNVFGVTDGTLALTMTENLTGHSTTTSAVAGVQSTGAKLFNVTGKDIQGATFPALTHFYGYQLYVASTGAGLTAACSNAPFADLVAIPKKLSKGRAQHQIEDGIAPAGNLTFATVASTGLVDLFFAVLGKG